MSLQDCITPAEVIIPSSPAIQAVVGREEENCPTILALNVAETVEFSHPSSVLERRYYCACCSGEEKAVILAASFSRRRAMELYTMANPNGHRVTYKGGEFILVRNAL